jgi:aspartyl protease family protein
MSTFRFFIGVMLSIAMSATWAEENGQTTDLYSQLDALQAQSNIKISGLENIQDEPKITAHGNLEQQLERLLAFFNHITSRNQKGQIERVVILNKKQKRELDQIILPARLEGKHLLVSVLLSGDGRVWQTVDMMLDTGADTVVLPESMIAGLGLLEADLVRQSMQTANGTTEAKIGVLQALKLAGETVTDVEVAFVADKLLGKNRLLGMSVLGRYQVHMDDKTQLVTLLKK